MQPSVYVAVPLGESKKYCFPQLLDALENLDYDNWVLGISYTKPCSRIFPIYVYDMLLFTRLPPWHLMSTELKKERYIFPTWMPVVLNMNRLREDFLETDAEYMFIIGADNPPPRYALKRLLSHNKDIVGAYIYMRKDNIIKDLRPCVYRYEWMPTPDIDERVKETWSLGWFEEDLSIKPGMGLVKVDAVGSGCMLVKREVLEKLGPFQRGWDFGEDANLCHRANRAGYEVYCDTDLHVSHIGEDGVVV